ncbi:hypothetical protein ASD04_00580 [Devosia sp. Root436]|uniref:DUF1345 domain-containing protein n=1 Tax=Devosia sp. Root436 TaxID=1736537 RepID=UPI0007000FE2|nr:DUF1345 domain-containing protein [Devosia sp. Root436]KQX42503.1 hypothetical protein ASD04_00580 [Devosia sp. Root436]
MATRRKQTVKNTVAKPTGRRAAFGLRIASMRLPRHGAFFIALASGLAVFFVTLWLWPAFAVPIGAIAMFAIYLALVGAMLPVLTSDFLRSRADEADTPTGFIFAAVIGVVGVCCATLFMALNGNEDGPLLEEVLLSVASVLLGWFTIHTMAALHYAYEYYESPSANPESGKGGELIGGLDFPEGDNPDGVAFLYFAYVIGTAFAVSDIRITSNKMRKIVLLHSTFSYFFNTLIVAATVNVAVAVGGI